MPADPDFYQRIDASIVTVIGKHEPVEFRVLCRALLAGKHITRNMLQDAFIQRRLRKLRESGKIQYCVTNPIGWCLVKEAISD